MFFDAANGSFFGTPTVCGSIGFAFHWRIVIQSFLSGLCRGNNVLLAQSTPPLTRCIFFHFYLTALLFYVFIKYLSNKRRSYQSRHKGLLPLVPVTAAPPFIAYLSLESINIRHRNAIVDRRKVENNWHENRQNSKNTDITERKHMGIESIPPLLHFRSNTCSTSALSDIPYYTTHTTTPILFVSLYTLPLSAHTYE